MIDKLGKKETNRQKGKKTNILSTRQTDEQKSRKKVLGQNEKDKGLTPERIYIIYIIYILSG